ncbi:MAG: MogA/MoaB family molybdenum cofactor biosynthesis protein [Planctomycetes bacterium]|nr:MogA/MoaB family molybdenum cofactor biosynthesis protein [Planctomycetota bacterium]
MANSYSSESAQEHRRQGPQSVRCAVLTVSDTRNLDDDKSGQTIVELLQMAGHEIADRALVPDEPALVTDQVRNFSQNTDVDVILVTGGTGIAARDQTPDAVAQLLTKQLPGYGELLRMLSYQEIGAAAMLSRAMGGLVEQTVVLTMPGSTAAVRLAMEKIILPELSHLVSLAKS